MFELNLGRPNIQIWNMNTVTTKHRLLPPFTKVSEINTVIELKRRTLFRKTRSVNCVEGLQQTSFNELLRKVEIWRKFHSVEWSTQNQGLVSTAKNKLQFLTVSSNQITEIVRVIWYYQNLHFTNINNVDFVTCYF